MKKIIKCPICRKKFKDFINLGKHPCADTFLRNKQESLNLKKYPLIVGYCICEHMSAIYKVSPFKRYKENEYSYTSNNSPVSISHFSKIAKKIVKKFKLDRSKKVIEVGSNDGTFLKNIKDISNAEVLGIDPSDNMCKLAKKKGIDSLNIFFNSRNVNMITKKYGKFDVLYGANVFNHIDDPKDFLLGCKKILKKSGALILEVPDLESLFNSIGFDTIYHEHRQYFSKKSVNKIFKFLNLRIMNIENIDYMSGSIRIFAKNDKYNLKIFKTKTNFSKFKFFKKNIFFVKKKILEFINENKINKKKIIGIGAATKGNTLLNFCNISDKDINYIIENSPHKIGKFTPGTGIKILDEKKMKIFQAAIILPWNITKHLTKKFLQNSKVSYISIQKVVKSL